MTGTVRNRADGTVEAILQSDSEGSLRTLIERIREGPPPARVEDVEIEVERTDRVYDTMSIVR